MIAQLFSNRAPLGVAPGHLVLIFDLDGTLVDCMELHAKIFASLLSNDLGSSYHEAFAEYRRTAGAPFADQVRAAAPASVALTSSEVERVARRFTDLVRTSRPVLFEEVTAVIACLKGAGCGLAVSSGGPPELVRYKMKASGLGEYFDLALGTDAKNSDMMKGAGHFRLIREHFGLSVDRFREQAAMIGDTVHDMELAKLEGLPAIGRAGWSGAQDLLAAGASMVVADLTELLELFEFKRDTRSAE